MDVVDKIASVKVNSESNKPESPVTVTKAEIQKFE
jgi:hypothetical protein